MKKILAMLLAAMMLLTVGSIAVFADDPVDPVDPPEPVYVKVTFDARNGSDLVVDDAFLAGGLAAAPAEDPVKEGYVFWGWYNNKTCGPFEFDKTIDKDTVVYARWIRAGSDPLFQYFDLLNVFRAIQQLWMEYLVKIGAVRPLADG